MQNWAGEIREQCIIMFLYEIAWSGKRNAKTYLLQVRSPRLLICYANNKAHIYSTRFLSLQ